MFIYKFTKTVVINIKDHAESVELLRVPQAQFNAIVWPVLS
jgi:hypothetical protein